MMGRTPKAGRRGGFTLLEMTVVVTLLGLVLGSLAMMSSANDRAFQAGSVRASLEAQASVAMDRALQDVRIAVRDSLTPALDPGELASSIEYVQAVGLSGTEVELGERRRLAFEYAKGEVDDGVDNNGNGLVDEGLLVLTEDLGTADERRRVLTRWVRETLAGEEQNGLDDDGDGLIDEPGFMVRRSGDTLIFELTLEKTDREGRSMLRTSRSSAKLRN